MYVLKIWLRRGGFSFGESERAERLEDQGGDVHPKLFPKTDFKVGFPKFICQQSK